MIDLSLIVFPKYLARLGAPLEDGEWYRLYMSISSLFSVTVMPRISVSSVLGVCRGVDLMVFFTSVMSPRGPSLALGR